MPPSVPKFPPLLTPSPSASSLPDSAEFGRAKRTPKANPTYNNPTEFVTGNEKLPPPEKLKVCLNPSLACDSSLVGRRT